MKKNIYLDLKKVIPKIALATALCIGFTGCGTKNNNSNGSATATDSTATDASLDTITYTEEYASSTEALVIGDYSIKLNELMVYAINDIISNNLTPSECEKDEDTNKDAVLSLIRTTKIQYDVALHNDVTMDDDDIAAKDTLVANFKKAVPQEILDKYGISDEIIDEVFTEQSMVEKFSTDIKNDMGKSISDDLTDSYKDYKFHEYYYMVFPTIEVDDDDNPVTDDDGNYIQLSDDEKADAMKDAIEAATALRAGAGYLDVAKEYGVEAYSSEQVGYLGAYSDNMNEVFESLDDGDTSDVITSDMGYAVIYMIDAENDDLKDSYITSVAEDALDSQFDQLQQQWLATIPVDEENDIKGNAWADFSLTTMCRVLYNAGLVNPSATTN